MINNIIFDFNGTILNDAYLCYKIELEMVLALKLKPFSFKFYKDNFVHPIDLYYEKIGLDKSLYDYSKLNKEFFTQYSKRNEKEASLFKGVKKTLKTLKENNFNLYIISATNKNLLKTQLARLNILKYFNDVIGSDDINSKGKIEYGLEFINKYKLNKNNSILIGDTLHDYEVSNIFKIDVILFSKGHNSKKVLSVTNKKIFDNYKDIREYLLSLNEKEIRN